MKYKVGDKVRVRSDLTEGKEYGGVFVISDMSELRGKIVTIARILYDDCTPLKSCYTIKEMECCWTDDMFEPVPYDGKMDAIRYSEDIQKMIDDMHKFFFHSVIKDLTNEIKGEGKNKMNDKKTNNKKKKMTQRERLEMKLEECRNNSIVHSVEVVVPDKVVKVVIDHCYGLEEYKLVCDPQDAFSVERAIILALVKDDNANLTPEGIEHEADQFKFFKSNIAELKAAMRVYKAQLALKEYDEKEKAEKERVRINKQRKKIAQKARRAERLAEEKLKETKEAAKIYAEALKSALCGYEISENTVENMTKDMNTRV